MRQRKPFAALICPPVCMDLNRFNTSNAAPDASTISKSKQSTINECEIITRKKTQNNQSYDKEMFRCPMLLTKIEPFVLPEQSQYCTVFKSSSELFVCIVRTNRRAVFFVIRNHCRFVICDRALVPLVFISFISQIQLLLTVQRR